MGVITPLETPLAQSPQAEHKTSAVTWKYRTGRTAGARVAVAMTRTPLMVPATIILLVGEGCYGDTDTEMPWLGEHDESWRGDLG